MFILLERIINRKILKLESPNLLLSSIRHHNEGRVNVKIYPVFIHIVLVILKRHFSNGYQSLQLLSVPDRG
ncbi:hypothetical protein BpHYR1_051047 [Brachionus plicatilis]|uniref:Uncharacterized protein n=1 Tax=Brachionus plicatilis TaxID=10195 RepID=A0A3M7SUS8_BRAPC|nr:hypothetical protein BpHYR1_051047 [Brachionus plicatilis]